MKIKLLLLLLFLFFSQGICAHLTYYGPSGYTFVPDAFVADDWKYSGFTGGEFVALQNVRLYPKYLAFRSSFFGEKLEISFSSAYMFVGDNGYKSHKVAEGLLPIVPALKWNVSDNSGKWVRVGTSAGYVYAYGGYFGVTTQLIKTPILQPEFTLAATTTLERGYGLIGGKLRGADFGGNPLPFAFTAEAGWASSIDLVGKTEESFLAFGSELDLGKNLTLSGAFRKDPATYYNYDDSGNRKSEKDGQNTQGKWSLRLNFHFDGIKHAGGKTL